MGNIGNHVPPHMVILKIGKHGDQTHLYSIVKYFKQIDLSPRSTRGHVPWRQPKIEEWFDL